MKLSKMAALSDWVLWHKGGNMDLTNYLKPELYILIPVLWLVGKAIKKSSIADKYIPLILGALGIVLSTAYLLPIYVPSTLEGIFELLFSGVTQGILYAAGSVYAQNIIVQAKKSETKDTKSSGASYEDG